MRTYTTGRAARLLGLGVSTMQRALIKSKVKAYKTPGGHFRILEKDLEEFAVNQGLTWPPPSSLDSRRRMKKLLIVDDQPSYIRLMEAAFTDRRDYQIQIARSGYEAGILTERFLPDVILLDMHLGDKDGREVCRLIKGTPGLRDIKVIAVTVLTEPRDVEEIMSAGADDYIAKPFDPQKLVEKVEALVYQKAT